MTHNDSSYPLESTDLDTVDIDREFSGSKAIKTSDTRVQELLEEQNLKLDKIVTLLEILIGDEV